MFDLGAGELVLIVFVVLILFGPKKLPELAQSLGRGMREFKRAQREFTEQINQAVNSDHYRKQRGPELDRPEGAVARGGSRRLDPIDERRDDSTGTPVTPPVASAAAPTVDAPSSVDAPPTVDAPAAAEAPRAAEVSPASDAPSDTATPTIR